MDAKTYQVAAERTESKITEIKFGTIGLHALLGMAILTGQVLDAAKKNIYYGREIDTDDIIDKLGALSGTAAFFAEHLASGHAFNPRDKDLFSELPDEVMAADIGLVDPRLLHGAIGVFTEGGELLEAVVKQLEGEKLDAVNVGEETGDVEWYLALLANATKTNLDDIRAVNIAKLQKRYPEKFNSVEALNRDLDGERKVLGG